MKWTKANIVSAAMVVAALPWLHACSVNPATGNADFVLMSENKEISIGKEEHAKILEKMPIYENESLQTYVDKVGQKVAATSDRPDLTYLFTIIDSPDINAFALPGGYIYINRGLIGFLNSEAELAAVLAHEIGHVTARHAVRQKAAAAGAKVASVVTAIAARSNTVGEVTSIYGAAAISGYGREMELEADGFGAKYLFNAGYDPKAMIEVIGVLKNHERFSRFRAKEAGKKAKSYHGVFSTHPSNDARLQEVIAKAGTLSQSGTQVTNEDGFRDQVDGLLWGKNYALNAGVSTDTNRYTHSKLGFTLVFPDEWKVENKGSAIIGAPADKVAELKLEVTRLKDKIPPDEFIRQKLNVSLLTRSEPLKQAGLMGHTGVRPAQGKEQYPTRMAVFYQANRVYHFTGSLSDPEKDVDYDQLFLDAVHSFRPVRSRGKRKAPAEKTIKYVKANSKTTFALLARHIKLGRYTEEQLRLLNGYYPRGEPKPGEWIKIID